MRDIEGIVLDTSNKIQDAHIKNISNNQNAVTNNKGFFTIKSGIGDSLVVSHMGMKDLLVVVKESNYQSERITINMSRTEIELDEVFLTKYAHINAVSLGIISKEVKQLSQNERRLYTAGDFKPIHLLTLLGGALQLDPIINKFSGRTKKIKQHIEIDRKKDNILFLNSNYYDYMSKDLKINDLDIDKFLFYIVEETTLQDLIDQNDNGKLKFFIYDWWIEFKKLQG
ncbi:carboxypeptidase-like regulatory domain-containing protein [Aquimarina sp. 2-A2]|uniref:carboxypeptidase-like regulatory domain-containing protein n=1 Tax=Aquimarina sp. 2-A2 TaxID=3382644 RepID=UPI00387F0ACC